MEKKTQINLIIGIISLVIVISIFLFCGNVSDKIENITNNYTQETLGSLGSQGEYAVKTTAHYQEIAKVPVVLHRIIVGTANDSVYFSNSSVTPADNGMLITATVPATFEIGAVYSAGLVANVTSTNGIIFVYSNYK